MRNNDFKMCLACLHSYQSSPASEWNWFYLVRSSRAFTLIQQTTIGGNKGGKNGTDSGFNRKTRPIENALMHFLNVCYAGIPSPLLSASLPSSPSAFTSFFLNSSGSICVFSKAKTSAKSFRSLKRIRENFKQKEKV